MDRESMRRDEMARNLCKPLGCRVVACQMGQRDGGCWKEMYALNECLRLKRQEIDQAIAEGRSTNSIAKVTLNCADP